MHLFVLVCYNSHKGLISYVYKHYWCPNNKDVYIYQSYLHTHKACCKSGQPPHSLHQKIDPDHDISTSVHQIFLEHLRCHVIIKLAIFCDGAV